MKCTTCNGRRTVVQDVPETKYGSIAIDSRGFPCWGGDGTTTQRVAYPTGQSVKRAIQCPACQGIHHIGTKKGHTAA